MHEYVKEWWESKVFKGHEKSEENLKKFEDHFGSRDTFSKRMEDRDNLRDGQNFAFVLPKIGRKKSLMKALVFTDKEQLQYQSVPSPTPKGEELLVKVSAAGICGSDMHAYHGFDDRRIPPLILGHEISGTIENSNYYSNHQSNKNNRYDKKTTFPFLTNDSDGHGAGKSSKYQTKDA